jgi:short subunit dehydrogenase-like uncharacterized protein
MLVIYGAYGYTGELVARRAVERGLKPILAGRDEARLARLAGSLGLPHRAFALDDPEAVEGGLSGARAVLHCAGPFFRTALPMARACVRARCHYLDITGEISVFRALHATGPDAERAGVMLLPGVGFDVVPTDCLAAHLARRLPGAARLTLAFQGLGRVSRGTARTMLESSPPALARRGPWRPPVRVMDLGDGPRVAMSIPWGDVFTAPISTGIPDVAVYMAVPLRTAVVAPLLLARPLLRVGAVRDLAASLLTGGEAGPSEAERARGRAVVWGEAEDGRGGRARARLRTPDGYAFTALSAVAIAERVLAGEVKPGFRTPSLAFGPDLAIAIPGVVRTDL